jgi:ketosteroid isomerase-like protein
MIAAPPCGVNPERSVNRRGRNDARPSSTDGRTHESHRAGSSREAAMSELDAFLATTLTRQVEADSALLNGDPTRRLALWSTGDGVTMFGPWGARNAGWEEVRDACRQIAARWAARSTFHFDLVAADVSGDLAFTVGYEHCALSLDGGPPARTTLRVTHVYRREPGGWTIVHRHGDIVPEEQSAASPDAGRSTGP